MDEVTEYSASRRQRFSEALMMRLKELTAKIDGLSALYETLLIN